MLLFLQYVVSKEKHFLTYVIDMLKRSIVLRLND